MHLLTEEEKRALEKGFLDSYNSLTFLGCDGFFRVMTEVRLIVGTIGQTFSNRRLQEGFDSNNATNATLSLNQTNVTSVLGPALFAVKGQVRTEKLHEFMMG